MGFREAHHDTTDGVFYENGANLNLTVRQKYGMKFSNWEVLKRKVGMENEENRERGVE